MKQKDKVNPKVKKFYDWLWIAVNILFICLFIAAAIYLKVKFDTWYINWILK